VRTDLTEDILLRLEISDTSGMLNTYSRLQDLSDTAAVLRGLINTGSGGSSGTYETIEADSISVLDTDEEVTFISSDSALEPTIYLNSNLTLDSLSAVYFENHTSVDLTIISGITNNVNGSVNVTFTIPPRGGMFIRCLGDLGSGIRFSAIGNYTQL